MSDMSLQKLDRRKAVAKLLGASNDTLIVTGLGSPSYDVHAAKDADNHYYLWGAMGGAALVGLGLAQAQPEKRVMVITGDGEMLMAFGALATISVAKPDNLDIIVLDNQHFGETGMQQSHTGMGVDFAKVAHAAGFADTGSCRTMDDLNDICVKLATSSSGPRLYVMEVEAQNHVRSLPPRDAVFIKNRFRSHLGFEPC